MEWEKQKHRPQRTLPTDEVYSNRANEREREREQKAKRERESQVEWDIEPIGEKTETNMKL